MAINDEQRQLLIEAEALTASGDPAGGAAVVRQLIETFDPADHENRGRLTITRAHFLKQAGESDDAIDAYLKAASLLEPIRGEAILEAAHALFGAGMLLVDTDHADAPKIAARALELYQRFPFTTPADLADAAALNLQARIFVDGETSAAEFEDTWRLIRPAPPAEMTDSLLKQWLLLVQTYVEALPVEEASEFLRDVEEWYSGAQDEIDAAENSGDAPPQDDGPPPITADRLLDEIREGYDALIQAREQAVVLPQVEVEVIEMTLQNHDPEIHPAQLLAGSFFSLGKSFTELDNDEMAEHCYLRALQCDPAHANARYNLGNVLLRRGNYADAAAHFEQVVSADPDNDFAIRNLTYALAQDGDLTAAIDAAVTTALAATKAEISAARLLELCEKYSGWEIARPLVEAKLQAASADAERVRHLRALLKPLLEGS